VIERSAYVVALAALLFTAAPGSAQRITSPYDFVEESQGLRAFGGYVLTDRGTLDTGPGSSYAAGLGYTLRISGPFNLDARVAYMPTDRRVYDTEPTDSAVLADDPTAGLVEVGTADLSLLLADASLRFDLTGARTWHRIQPYALLGVGGVFRVASDNAAEDLLSADAGERRVRFRNGVTGHVGAGFELHMSDRFTVLFDARDLLWKLHHPNGFREPGRVISSDEWVQTAHLSLGLVLRF
jgi:hypothetical protein